MGILRGLVSLAGAVALLWACGAQPAPKHAPPAAHSFALPPERLGLARSCEIPNIRESVLKRVNAARASGASCGAQRMPPASPLVWNAALSSAAGRHSADMARRDYLDHATPEGQRVGARAKAEGYAWRAVGENIAGGDRSVDKVVQGWMASPGHCRNIMNPEFRDIGMACVEREGTTWGTYWTMVLGRPQ